MVLFPIPSVLPRLQDIRSGSAFDPSPDFVVASKDGSRRRLARLLSSAVEEDVGPHNILSE
jgi:hypothetical protein